MKILVVTLIFLLSKMNLQSADFIIEGSGIEETVSIFNYDKEKLFILWKAKVQNKNNLGVLSVGNCGGTIQMLNGQQEQNIMCEIRNKYGKFNWINNKAKGDAGAAAGNANTQHFIIVGGDGVWKDFIGVKCLGAYFGMPENHFTWKGKCNVPDSLMKNTKQKIANFKEDN